MKMVIIIYYLVLMFIFLNIFYLQKLMKKVILTEILKHQKNDYEIGRTQTFISEFNNKKIRKLAEELKEKLNL